MTEERPIYFREITWQFIIKNLGMEELKKYNLEKPGEIAYEAGVIKRPDLLNETVIDLDDGVDYLIDKKAASELASNQKEVALIRMYDKKVKVFPIKEIVEAIKNGPTFDQLTNNNKTASIISKKDFLSRQDEFYEAHVKFHSANAFCGTAGKEEMRHIYSLIDELTDAELIRLVKRCGVGWTDKEAKETAHREDYEGVVDEIDREDFYREYYKIVLKKKAR